MEPRFDQLRLAEALDTTVRETRLCPPEMVPEVLGMLAKAQGVALARLLNRTPDAPVRNESEKQGDDRLLTVAEASQMMAVSKYWLYSNGPSLPFALRISSGRIRFSKNGLERWIRRRTSG
jgi:predicted DNA-binding transcriptional regulator AlpA